MMIHYAHNFMFDSESDQHLVSLYMQTISENKENR